MSKRKVKKVVDGAETEVEVETPEVKVGDRVLVEVEATVHSVVPAYVDKTGQGKDCAGGITIEFNAQRITKPLGEVTVVVPAEVAPE